MFLEFYPIIQAIFDKEMAEPKSGSWTSGFEISKSATLNPVSRGKWSQQWKQWWKKCTEACQDQILERCTTRYQQTIYNLLSSMQIQRDQQTIYNLLSSMQIPFEWEAFVSACTFPAPKKQTSESLLGFCCLNPKSQENKWRLSNFWDFNHVVALPPQPRSKGTLL